MHGATAASVDGGGAADLPEHVLGLRAVDQHHASRKRCARAAHGEGLRHLEYPRGVRITPAVQRQVAALDHEGAACCRVDTRCEHQVGQVARAGV